MKKIFSFIVFMLFTFQLHAISVDTVLNGSYYMYVINASNGYTGIADRLNYKPYVELQKILVHFESDSLVFYKNWEHLWKIQNVQSEYYENCPTSNIFMMSILEYNAELGAYDKESTCIIDLNNPLKPYVFSVKDSEGFIAIYRNAQVENNIPFVYLNWIPYSLDTKKRKYYQINMNDRKRREISVEDYIPKSAGSKFVLEKNGQFRSIVCNYVFPHPLSDLFLNDSTIVKEKYGVTRNDDDYWIVSPLSSSKSYSMLIYNKKKNEWKYLPSSYDSLNYTYMKFEHFIFLQETYNDEKIFKGVVTIMDLEEGTVDKDLYFGDYTRILNINSAKKYWLLSQPNMMMVLKKYDDIRKGDTRPSIIGNIPYSKAAITVFAWLEPVKTKKVHLIDAQGKTFVTPVILAPK